MKALKVLVLLLSISAASVLVWNATRNKNPEYAEEEEKISPKKMQGSSKMRVVIDSENIKEITQAEDDEVVEIIDGSIFSKVTDEEVKKTREMMMSTSKSGRIMSDDKIREMLENQKKEALKQKADPHLMPSSKSFSGPIFKPKDLEEIIEDKKEVKKEEVELIPSSKSPIRLIEPKDVERIMEDGKSDFVKPQEPKLPPLESDK